MAVTARLAESEYVYSRSSNMRVYTHRTPQAIELGNDAVDIAAPERRKIARENRKSAVRRMAVSCAILMFAAIVLAVLVRYAMITEQYSVVNDYREIIEENERMLAELEVKLNSAVSLDEARQAALAAGLSHPTAAQIIHLDGAAGH